MSIGVGVDWLDWILQKVVEVQECQLLFKKVATVTTRVKEVATYLHQ